MKHGKAFFLAVLLAGCGSLPAERSIRIDLPGTPAAQPLAGKDFSLRLLRFEARGALQERNLAYIESGAPTDLRQAATIAWEEPPEAAAASFLAQALRGAGAHVITSGIPGLAAYNLFGTVQRFELVGGGATGIATVALDLSVTDAKSGAPYFNASYCAAAKAADQSLVAAQRAFDGALGDIATHFVSDLANRANGGKGPPVAPRGSRLQSC